MKIRKTFVQFCFLSIVLLYGCAPNNADIKPTIKNEYNFQSDSIAVLQVLTTQESAWNNGDIEGFMDGYWEDEQLTFIGSRGVTYGWQQTLENYKKGYPDLASMGQLTFDILELKSLGTHAAQVIGRYTLERENDQPTGYFNLIFQKIAGEWKLTSDMTVNSPTVKE